MNTISLIKRYPLSLLIIVSVGLNFFWLWWGLPNGEIIWAVDGIAPLEPLAAAKSMFVDDWWNSGYLNKYPMGHFFILMAVYAPYLAYLFATGGFSSPSAIYPYGLSDPETALTVFILLANGVSAIMGVGIVVLVYLTARDLFDQRGAIFSALVVAFSPVFIYYSHTSNVDVPSLFWCALGLFAFARLVQGKMQRSNFVLLGLAVGMAMATKEQVFGLFVLLPLPILFLQIKHDREAESQPYRFSIREAIRSLFAPNILWGLGTCILVFTLATHLIFNWDGNVSRLVWRIYETEPVGEGNFPYETYFPVEIGGVFEGWRQTFLLLWDSMNPFLFIAGIAGILCFAFRERWAVYFVVPFLSYLLFLVPTREFLRARFVMELILVLALFAGRYLSTVWSWSLKRHWALTGIVGLLWVYSFFYGFSVDYLMMYDARYKAEAWIQANIPTGARVETYAKPTYLPRFPKSLNVTRLPLTEKTLAGLPYRSPDYLVLSKTIDDRLVVDSDRDELITHILQDYTGYRQAQRFRTSSLLGPNLIPGLSPEIIILQKQRKSVIARFRSTPDQ